MDSATLDGARILIVDDQEGNVALLERTLKLAGYEHITSTTDSTEVEELCTANPPDLILLDLHMPPPDGFEVMRLLGPWLEKHWLPILVLTADITPEAKQEALACGAKDFVTKPFDRTEVLLRIRNLLEARFLQLELQRHNVMLEQRVYERTQELDEARVEILARLAVAAEYRDDATGEHTRRVGRSSALVARALGMAEDQVELIRHTAPLHDVGKIGIPDQILLKRGRLTAEEFEVMATHVSIGRFILSGSRSPLLQTAEEIAFSHHEWWDGSGYLAGLCGSAIPLSGRIVAIADVFDSLTHERPYKMAWPVEVALGEIRSLSGRQFDPQAVEAFETLDHMGLLGPVGVEPAPERGSVALLR